MSRTIPVAAAQMGPIARDEPRASAVARMMEMMREAHARGARLVVFPELALTTFFPRWWMEDEAELDGFYEEEMPSAVTAPLFDLGRELEVGFYLGYAEIVREGNRKRRFNTSILVDRAGRIAGRYRKVHLPGPTPTTSRTGRSSTWRRHTSSPVTSAFRSSTHSTAASACASATTGAGRRPTG